MPKPKTYRRREAAPVVTHQDHRAILARRLDLMAGIELQQGHHLAAEHLARRAAEMRETRP